MWRTPQGRSESAGGASGAVPGCSGRPVGTGAPEAPANRALSRPRFRNATMPAATSRPPSARTMRIAAIATGPRPVRYAVNTRATPCWPSTVMVSWPIAAVPASSWTTAVRAQALAADRPGGVLAHLLVQGAVDPQLEGDPVVPVAALDHGDERRALDALEAELLQRAREVLGLLGLRGPGGSVPTTPSASERSVPSPRKARMFSSVTTASSSAGRESAMVTEPPPSRSTTTSYSAVRKTMDLVKTCGSAPPSRETSSVPAASGSAGASAALPLNPTGTSRACSSRLPSPRTPPCTRWCRRRGCRSRTGPRHSARPRPRRRSRSCVQCRVGLSRRPWRSRRGRRSPRWCRSRPRASARRRPGSRTRRRRRSRPSRPGTSHAAARR